MQEHLILVAHGAVDTPRSNQPIVDLAGVVSSSRNFASVTPAFLNGTPNVTDVLDRIATQHSVGPNQSHRAVVVPVMTSQGYYLKKLPGMLEQNQSFGHFDLRMTTVAGMHDRLPQIMWQRVESHLERLSDSGRKGTVVIIGHGTRRNATSGQSTFDLVSFVQSQIDSSRPECSIEVRAGFLDQDPELESVFQAIPEDSDVIAMPFLVALGPHMTDDVPRALGLEGSPELEFPIVAASAGRTILCDIPIAQYPEMPSLVVDLASSFEPVVEATYEPQ